MTDQILQLAPTAGLSLPLQGLYLQVEVPPPDWRGQAFVYSNFVASIDGRIALADPAPGVTRVPDTIANPRDWRLFQELAAHADLLLSSGAYLREFAAGQAQDGLPVSSKPPYADLIAWRRSQGYPAQPDVAVFSNSLDFALPPDWLQEKRRVFVLTTASPDSGAARQLTAAGVSVVSFSGSSVSGNAAVDFLTGQGYRRIYSVGGPHVLRTLLADDVLDTLFLTTVHRLVGGSGAPGILEGAPLSMPADFRLSTLYYDPHSHDGTGQTFARYDRISLRRRRSRPASV